MEITGPPPDLKLSSAADLKRMVLEFRVGQILRAISEGQIGNGLLKLRIGQQVFAARSQVPIESGRNLSLQVEKAGPQPQLRILDPLPPPAVRAEALRQVLPRMLELAPALDRMADLARPDSAASKLPPALREPVQALVRQLPATEQMTTPKGLQQALVQSGLFTEAMLAQGKIPSGDLKDVLQRLATRLRSMASESPAGARPESAANRPAGHAATPERGQAQAMPTAQAARPAAQAGQQPAPAATTQAAPGKTTPPPPLPGRPQAGGAEPQARTPGAPAPAAGEGAKATGGPPTAGTTNPAPKGDAATPTTQSRPGAESPATAPPPRPGPPAAPAAPGRPAPASTTPTTPSTAQSPAPTTPQAAPGQMVKTLIQGQADVSPQRPSTPATPQTLPDPAAGRVVNELSRQVEGALSRIQYNQLNSLPQEDPNRLVWQLDLPLRHGERLDNLRLRVEEEKTKRKSGGYDTAWRVDLEFRLDPLGPMRVRIGLLGEQVSGVFWAERMDTTRLIERRLGELQENLERVGLEVGQLAARRGTPPPPNRSTETDGLLDEQA